MQRWPRAHCPHHGDPQEDAIHVADEVTLRGGCAAGLVVMILGCSNPLETVRQEAMRDMTHLALGRQAQNIEMGTLQSGSAPATAADLQTPLGVDAWDTPLVYVPPNGDVPYDLISYGADKAEGGTGLDADISYRKDVAVDDAL